MRKGNHCKQNTETDSERSNPRGAYHCPKNVSTRSYRPLYNFEEEEVVCLSTMTNYARGRMQEDWEGVHSIFRAMTFLFGGGP